MDKKLNMARWFSLFMCIYCVFTVVQNLFEMKTIGTATFSLMGGGTVVSWIPFMTGDIISEIWGKKDNVKVFTIAGIINLIVVLLAQIVIALPGTYPDQNVAFNKIFSNGIRSAIASFVAFWIGNYVNTAIMVDMRNYARKMGKDNGFLFFVRAVTSTLAGQFLDNFIFLALAFAPVGISVFEMSWATILSITLTGTLLETAIESCLVPFITRPLTNILKNKYK